MRVVVDTSTLVSAFLWQGIPYRLVLAAEASDVMLYTSPALLEELSEVLARQKFAPRLAARQVTVEEVIAAYLNLAHLITPPPITPVITDDPDDDAVLACAWAARAHAIVSSDAHLLRLQVFRSIPVVSPRVFLSTLFPSHPA